MPASITLVVAYAANYTIGVDNALPWRLPGDLKHFKAITLGRPIIMGRKTWESLGRALPGRRNLVISRTASYLAAGAEVFASLDAALAACTPQDAVCIIGGAQLYALALPLATHIEATEIDAKVEGDAHFVALAKGRWHETARHPQPEENGWRYDFVSYERRIL
jgi:dihydrofolate reductase